MFLQVSVCPQGGSPSGGVLHPRGFSIPGGVLHPGGVVHPGGVLHQGGFSFPGGSPSGVVLHPGGVLHRGGGVLHLVNVRAVRFLLECILVFMQFSGNFGRIIGWCPQLWCWRPSDHGSALTLVRYSVMSKKKINVFA